MGLVRSSGRVPGTGAGRVDVGQGGTIQHGVRRAGLWRMYGTHRGGAAPWWAMRKGCGGRSVRGRGSALVCKGQPVGEGG